MNKLQTIRNEEHWHEIIKVELIRLKLFSSWAPSKNRNFKVRIWWSFDSYLCLRMNFIL
jgi:hypothetical protein